MGTIDAAEREKGQAQSTASNYCGADTIADLGHTLTWEGVTSVTVGGSPVTEYSMGSASGTNYMSAVPEPASAGLLLIAAGLFAARRSRQ